MGGAYKKVGKVLNPFAIPQRLFKGTALAKWTNVPLSTWVSGEKSFADSLRTTGTPVEQAINNWVLNTAGVGKKNSTYYSMPRSSMDTSGMFAGQNQMLANMQAQASANAARQQASLNQLRSSSPLFPTMPAPETPAQIAQSTPAISAPSTIAQSKTDGTTSVASDLPVEFVYKPATATAKNVAANTFTLPDMSNIKFGGT